MVAHVAIPDLRRTERSFGPARPGRSLLNRPTTWGLPRTTSQSTAGSWPAWRSSPTSTHGRPLKPGLTSELIQPMSGRWKIKHPEIRAIALRVRDAFPAAQVRYTWVPRAQNVAADALVNESLDNVAAGLSRRIDRFS